MKLKFRKESPGAFLEDLLDLNFFGGDEKVFDVTYVPAKDKNTKVLVVTGQNASGKSYLRRIISAALKTNDKDMEVMNISQEKRTGADGSSTIANSFIFGDERTQATGVNSLRTVTVGITTCRGREKMHAITWDEPDLGLSDEYAMDLGHKIADFAKEPTKTFLITVISHRRELLQPIAECDHHYIHVGPEKPGNLLAWINRKVVRLDIDDLQKKSREQFLAIARFDREK
jgi:hypothetical protein